MLYTNARTQRKLILVKNYFSCSPDDTQKNLHSNLIQDILLVRYKVISPLEFRDVDTLKFLALNLFESLSIF